MLIYRFMKHTGTFCFFFFYFSLLSAYRAHLCFFIKSYVMAGPCVAAVWERSREVPFPFAQPIQRLPKITNLSRARSNPLKERCFCCISVLLARRAGWPCGKVPNYCVTAQPRCSGWKPLCCRHCFPHTVCPWHTLLLGLQEQHVHWHPLSSPKCCSGDTQLCFGVFVLCWYREDDLQQALKSALRSLAGHTQLLLTMRSVVLYTDPI